MVPAFYISIRRIPFVPAFLLGSGDNKCLFAFRLFFLPEESLGICSHVRFWTRFQLYQNVRPTIPACYSTLLNSFVKKSFLQLRCRLNVRATEARQNIAYPSLAAQKQEDGPSHQAISQ